MANTYSAETDNPSEQLSQAEAEAGTKPSSPPSLNGQHQAVPTGSGEGGLFSPPESKSFAQNEHSEPEAPTQQKDIGTEAVAGAEQDERLPSAPPPAEAKYKAERDVIAPEVKRIGRIHQGTEFHAEEVKIYFGAEGKEQALDEVKQWIERPDFSKEQLTIEELKRVRESYLERPGYYEAIRSLAERDRLLLLIGPDGCGLHASVHALSYELNVKVLRAHGKVYEFSSVYQISPELLLRDENETGNSIILLVEGMESRQSLATRLFQGGRDAVFSHVADRLRQIGSWMIITGPVEPSHHHAKVIYEVFRRHNRIIELGMPDMKALLEQLIKQECGNRSAEALKFLSEHFPDATRYLGTSQDAEHFARKCQDILTGELEVEERKQKISEVLSGLASIRRNVHFMLEKGLKLDSDVFLAILLSVLNGIESNLFWQVFDYVSAALEFDQGYEESDEGESENKDKDEGEDKEQGEGKEQQEKDERKKRSQQNRRRVFTYGRIERLRSIRAEEIAKKELVDGEDIVYKVVRYIDDRYAGEILDYARQHYEKQIMDICKALQKPFIEQQPNNVNVRILMARAIATLTQTNWHEALVPILSGWAICPQAYMRATVGYALDQVLRDETYVGNARHLLNEWITAPIVGETSWHLKWTVASACKQMGLIDIEFGLAYLKKLASYLGQRDLGRAESVDELVFLLLDSQVESQVVYTAIQYSMVVLCLQGYMESVMHELQLWISEPLNKNPLSFVATTLILGIFREFGYLADNSRQAAIQANWASDTLREWSIQVFPGSKPAYIYNRVLQYLIEKLNNRELSASIAIAIARSFAISRQVGKKHDLIYAIFFQWADELGAGKSIPQLREGYDRIHKLFMDICRQLDGDDLNEIRTHMAKSQSDEQLPEHVRGFAGRVLRDLNAPSIRYTRRDAKS